MATRSPEEETTAFTQVSMTEIERALEELTQEVAKQKRQLAATFRHIHEMVAEREATLMAELDAIPAGVAVRVEENGASLDQLRKLEEEIVRQIQDKRLAAFLQQQMTNIRTEMDRILSEIFFPRVSTSCQLEDIRRTLEEKCLVQKRHNPYKFRTFPVWSGVTKPVGQGYWIELTEICIDPATRLIYVAEDYVTRDYAISELHVFTSEGNYHSHLQNEELTDLSAMKIDQDFLYFSTSKYSDYFLVKLNKNDKTIKREGTTNRINVLFIDTGKLYTCYYGSQSLQLYNLNLQPTNQIQLNINIDNYVTINDIIVNKEKIITLFSGRGRDLPSHISIFQLDGTLIRSLAAVNDIKNAHYFCLDSYENILVSDFRGQSIRIFSSDGFLLQSIDVKGEHVTSKNDGPRGIAVDSRGRIIIANSKFSKLQAF